MTVTVNRQINQLPVAVADSYTTEFETALAIDATAGVLASDSDPDGDTLTAELVTGPTNGSLTLNTEGDFDYVPNTKN